MTVLAGWGLAAWLFPALGVWVALLVGAALAPTDAALGVPVVTNPAVPSRVRRLITVESGLNDGIATPIVTVAIAGAVAAEEAGASGPGGALVELAIGVAVGVAVGFAGGWLLRWARDRGWAAEDFTGIAVLALALLAYLASVAVDGNGFVAAFCGGIAFGPRPVAAARQSSLSSSRPAGRSRFSCGWPSAPSPCRSPSTGRIGPSCCTPSSASLLCGWSRSPLPSSERHRPQHRALRRLFGPRGWRPSFSPSSR